MKRTRRGEALACNFNKSNAPPWVFFTFFKFCKLYQSRKASHICVLDGDKSSFTWNGEIPFQYSKTFEATRCSTLSFSSQFISVNSLGLMCCFELRFKQK